MHDYDDLLAQAVVSGFVLALGIFILGVFWPLLNHTSVTETKPAAGDMLPDCMIQVEDY